MLLPFTFMFSSIPKRHEHLRFKAFLRLLCFGGIKKVSTKTPKHFHRDAESTRYHSISWKTMHSQALTCPPLYTAGYRPNLHNRQGTSFQQLPSRLQPAAPRSVHCPLLTALHQTAALCFPASSYYSSSSHYTYSIFLIVPYFEIDRKRKFTAPCPYAR